MRRNQRVRFASEILIVTILLIYFQFLRPNCEDPIDWTQYAYIQYVTNSDYLCNSVMIFETLHRLGSKAERLMLVPAVFGSQQSWMLDLMLQARDEYNVRLKLMDIQTKGGDSTWSQSFTKLLAFNQTQYTRVLSLDSDATLLSHMDELFLLPSTPVAMPRAYWLPEPNPNQLTSSVLLLQPSHHEFSRIETAVSNAGERDFDMEILNQMYGKSAMVLPHRPYFLVTGEFRNNETMGHGSYLGGDEGWDVRRVRKEAKYVHFSDWPMPKPWIRAPVPFVQEQEPECGVEWKGEGNCATREVWSELYRDFAARRKRVCNLDTHTAEIGPDGKLGLDPSLRTGFIPGHEIT